MLLGSSGQERFRAISSQRNDMMLRRLERAGLDSEASSEEWEDDEKEMDGLALGFGGGVPPPPPLPGAASNSMAVRGAPPPALAVATAKVSMLYSHTTPQNWERDCMLATCINTLVTLFVLVAIKTSEVFSQKFAFLLLDLNLDLRGAQFKLCL